MLICATANEKKSTDGSSHIDVGTCFGHGSSERTYQKGPLTPYCQATLELCKRVAAHVH